MLEFNQFSKIIETGCLKTITEFITPKYDVKIGKVREEPVLEEIYGPSVEVSGQNFNYSCILEYRVEDNQKILDLLYRKYPFIKNDEIPEIDILDFLGEFLNILCGKINKELEKEDNQLSIEIPYFSYGLFVEEDQKIGTKTFSFDDLSFKLHYYIN